MSATGEQADKGAQGERFPLSYRWQALGLLMLIYVFNFVDRQIVNILAEAIKRDLHLSDVQLGAVTGIAFALLYSLLGIPIARLAERGDRPRIIAASVAIWSLFTTLCGMATSFTTLLLARIGVGIGEAGGVPPAHSLITEFSPREKRASAIAFFQMGIPIGSLVGLGLGGVLADAYGWRIAFYCAGLPGLLMALLALVVLREPRRDEAHVPPAAQGMMSALGTLLRIRTYRWILVGASLQSLVVYGIGSFIAPLFLRAHMAELSALAADVGLKPTGYLGIALGLGTGLAGAVGTLAGGWCADHFGRRDVRAYVIVPAIAALVSIPAYLFVLLTPSAALALIALAIPSAAVSMWYGPVHAANQGLVLPHMRATISAFALVTLNLIGLGLGPPLVGLLSEYFQHHLALNDAVGLQFALIATVLITIIPMGAFIAASRTIAAETVG